MTSSLVGSEMCIRDRGREVGAGQATQAGQSAAASVRFRSHLPLKISCLLYTSDAAAICSV
eukprot:12496153-Prorocentrum_lima.AAC.1